MRESSHTSGREELSARERGRRWEAVYIVRALRMQQWRWRWRLHCNMGTQRGQNSLQSLLRSENASDWQSLRAKGTLISAPRFFTPCETRFFPRKKGKTAIFKEKPSTKAIFPFSRGKNRISQGVKNRGSLISVPLALRDVQETRRGPEIHG